MIYFGAENATLDLELIIYLELEFIKEFIENHFDVTWALLAKFVL